MKNITPREQRQNKAKWQRISYLAYAIINAGKTEKRTSQTEKPNEE